MHRLTAGLLFFVAACGSSPSTPAPGSTETPAGNETPGPIAGPADGGPGSGPADGGSVADSGSHDAGCTSDCGPPPIPPVVALSAGDFHTCSLSSAGTVKCWGRGQDIQAGAPSGVTRPVTISAVAGAVEIATFRRRSCARMKNATLRCWGSEPGDGTTYSAVPVAVTSITGATAIGSGGASCAVIGGGALRCWGQKYNGQVGNNDDSEPEKLLPVAVLPSGVTRVTASTFNTCAVMTNGALECWGTGPFPEFLERTPVELLPAGSGIVSVSQSSDANHLCVLTASGAVRCMGSATYGRLGTNSTQDSKTFIDIPELASGAKAVAVGEGHACAITSAGGVACWGHNDKGQLGRAAGIGSSQGNPAVLAVPGLANVTAIALGHEHSCALASGVVKCWGSNVWGQLAGSAGAYQMVPVAVPGL